MTNDVYEYVNGSLIELYIIWWSDYIWNLGENSSIQIINKRFNDQDNIFIGTSNGKWTFKSLKDWSDYIGKSSTGCTLYCIKPKEYKIASSCSLTTMNH